MIDENLNFKIHIQLLAKRLRKLSGIFRKLRDVCNKELLILIYKALIVSSAAYCITVWGAAGKSILLEAERANRSILKIMLSKPFRYPTTLVYRDSQALSIRQLFILRTSLIAHKHTLNSDIYQSLLNKRVFRFPIPTVKSHFASRFGDYGRIHIYNVVLGFCDIKLCSVTEARRIISAWLLSLDYLSTENLLN